MPQNLLSKSTFIRSLQCQKSLYLYKRHTYLRDKISEEQQVQTAANLNEEIAKWQGELPIFLSGAINPASLIPVFRRQVTVLRMGCAHAIMLVNRPLMLSRSAAPSSIKPHVEECLSAAKQVLEMVLDFVADNHMFQGFWKTQVRLTIPTADLIC
ncbi:MAG: fungal specific transcription factor domain-containing protein [Pedobacter sp.]|nr:MAG: fungal specific transcription factor domain-containing protein [Pedobacter sp.]